MSSLVNFAKSELRSAGMFDPDADYDGEIATAVVALMETLTGYGHSGGSRELTLHTFNRLAQYKPLTPLTGDDSEWTEVSEEGGKPLFQNKRCSTVFKCNGVAWDIGPDNAVRATVTFPYTVR